jgi:hypothetical protein
MGYLLLATGVGLTGERTLQASLPQRADTDELTVVPATDGQGPVPASKPGPTPVHPPDHRRERTGGLTWL